LGGAGQAATLTTNAAKRLHRQGGADAGLLEALATAPAYGAPQSKSPLAGGAGSSGSGAGGSGKGSGATGPAFDIPTPEAAARSGSAPSAMSAAARALVDTGDSGFRTVPIGLAIATVLLVALGLTKRARARQGAGIR